MTPDLIAELRAERAALQRKLDAVDAMLGAYGEAPQAQTPAAPEPRHSSFVVRHRAKAQSSADAREKLPLSRFSTYGAAIIEGAISVIESRPGGPVPTREIVSALERRGLEVRGVDKVNAVSALLARSLDVVNHGRRGWTRSTERLVSDAPAESALPVLDLSPVAKSAFAEAFAAHAKRTLKEEGEEDFE